MNLWAGIGRATTDPEIRHIQNDTNTCVATWTMACDRKFKREGEPNADFIRCKAFGKTAEFVEKYFHKGGKYAVTGSIQTGSYTNKDGQKVYTTDIMVENCEFVESKGGNADKGNADGFKDVSEAIDEELPFA